MERYLKITQINLKLSLLPHLLIAIFLLVISPLLMGVENLDATRTARVLEMYVALLGILLLTPVFLPEQNKEIKELIRSKYTSIAEVSIIRAILAMVTLIVLVGGYVLLLKQNNCTFPYLHFYLGTLAEAVFLGGLGLCAYSIFDQIAIAYMLPIMYYILCFGSGKKLLKKFYLFSMVTGSYKEKVYLAITGILLVLIGIGWPYIRRKILPRRLKYYN